MRRFAAALLLLGACNAISDTYRESRFSIGYTNSFGPPHSEKGAVVFAHKEHPSLTITVDVAPRREEGRPQDRTLEASGEAALTMLKAAPNTRVESDKTLTVGHEPARLFRTRFDHNGAPYLRKTWVIQGRVSMAYVSVVGPAELFPSGEAAADVMLPTLRLEGDT